MTIQHGALRILNALTDRPDRPDGTAPQPELTGRLERELVAAVADPLVERSRIEHLLAQLAGRVGGSGSGGEAARLAVAAVLEVEGPQAAGELLVPWRAARRRAGSAGGCPGCATELELRVLAELGRYAEAAAVLDGLAVGAPQPGTWCPDGSLLGAALLPLLGAGRGLRAAAWHCSGLRRVAHDRTRLHLLADHLDFLRLTGNGPAAVELARTHTALLRAGATPAQRLRWLTAAAHAVAEQVSAGHGEDLVTVTWPEQPTEPMTLSGFGAALYARAHRIAAAFDARNGDRRRCLALVHPGLHDRARQVLPVNLRSVLSGPERPRRRTSRRPVTLQDVLACPDPYAEAEEAVLSCTLVDPVRVWEELVARAGAGTPGAGREAVAREAAARSVLARVLCLAGTWQRGLTEAAAAEALSAAVGDRVAAAAARATAAACWVQLDPRRGLALAQQAADDLVQLPPGVERSVALCRARSAGVAALLALDRLDEAARWMVQVEPVHVGQQVRVASQRAMVLRRRGRLPEAVQVLRAGAQLADAHGLVALGVEIRVDLAEVLDALGDTDGVVSSLTRVLLDLPYVPEPDPMEVPRVRMELARVLAAAGRFAPAHSELERARRELQSVAGTGRDLATVDYLLGVVLRGLGQLSPALTHLDRAAAAFARDQLPDGVALTERDRGAVLFALDRRAEAAAAFDAAVEASRAAQDDWHGLVCAIDAAQVRGYGGQPGAREELRRLRAALSSVAASGTASGPAEVAFQLARVDHALAHCALATGEVGAAAELAERALGGYRVAGAERAVAALSVDAGSWWWQAGDPGSAVRYLRGAMRSARALGDGPLIARCHAVLRQMGEAVATGDSDLGGTTRPRR